MILSKSLITTTELYTFQLSSRKITNNYYLVVQSLDIFITSDTFNFQIVQQGILMKYLLLAAFMLIALPLQATQITAYACDTCDSQGAQVLAKSHASPAQCNFTNPPGTEPTRDDMECYAAEKELIIVNPLTEQAFKFRVQRQCNGGRCGPFIVLNHLTLTSDEEDVLAIYYDIDSTMRSAIGQMNEMIAMSINGGLSLFNTTNSEQCSANPMDYFTNINTQRDIEREITLRISSKVGHKPWSEYITTNYGGPSSLQIGRRTANLTFDQKSISQPAYERYFFGSGGDFSGRNNLNFKVNYHGRVADQPGVSTLGLQLIVDNSTSWVDGYRLSNLMPNGGTVDLTDSLDSMPCFREFIDQQESEITGPPVSGGGTGGGQTTPGGGGGGDPLRLCPSQTVATTCSTTSDGTTTCTTTTFNILRMC